MESTFSETVFFYSEICISTGNQYEAGNRNGTSVKGGNKS